MTIEAHSLLQTITAGIFTLALIHAFSAKQFERFSAYSLRRAGLFHLLGEIEVVFGFWGIALIVSGHPEMPPAMQRWWLQATVADPGPLALSFGALGLTAIADNAALTYIGSLTTGIRGSDRERAEFGERYYA